MPLGTVAIALIGLLAVGVFVTVIVVPLAKIKNECASVPCKNGATCYDKDFGYTCECLVDGGFEGLTCETPAVADSWSNFTLITPCSVSCGKGVEVYNRTCNAAPTVYGAPCVGSALETRACTKPSCCSFGHCKNQATCADSDPTGYECTCKEYGGFEGKTCVTSVTQSQWGIWTDLTACSVTCGGGTKTRGRDCILSGNKYAQKCIGASSKTDTCNLAVCPIDGAMSQWSNWTQCSVSCGDGTQSKTRVCNNPAPQHGGKGCSEAVVEIRACKGWSQAICPIDGDWSHWDPWATCSKPCGTGTQDRNRTCDAPAPAHNGKTCGGFAQEVRNCNTDLCPIDGKWSTWTAFTNCTASCGGGTQFKTRFCESQAHGGASCVGETVEAQTCNNQACETDGSWATWKSWTACDESCGPGNQTRTRDCVGKSSSGADCVGPSTETQACFLKSCPIMGSWSAWKPWDDCGGATCGTTGWQLKHRACDDPAAQNGGLPCIGAAWMNQTCAMASCPGP